MITPSTSTTGVTMAQAYQWVARARFSPGRLVPPALPSVLRLGPRAAVPASGPASLPAAFATDRLV